MSDEQNVPLSPIKEREDRVRKLQDLRDAGIQPYPEKFDKKHMVAEIKKAGESEANIKEAEDITTNKPTTYQTAGRLVMFRTHGKLSFAHLLDDSGKMQIAFMQDVLGKDTYKIISKKLDLGDFVGVAGELFKTKHGEVTLLATEFTFLGKALLPLPDKFHGLKDKELLYRQRYLDLVANSETKKRFEFRSNFVRALREFYWQENFMEVETPTLMEQATGAAANPYATHYDALDLDMVLRISLELPLKKLIVGGFERVFEIGKVFRNEGIDPSHLPEHTQIEHYTAYWNFEDNIDFTERMFDYVFEKLGLPKKIMIKDKEGVERECDYTTPWERINYVERVSKDSGLDIMSYSDPETLRKDIKAKGIVFEKMDTMGLTTLIDHLYKKVTRPNIVGPAVVYNYPLKMQPLARRSDTNPDLVDQFQVVVNGWEILKAYSELVDPIDQEERFVEQLAAKSAGDDEAMDMEKDYLIAMEHGMPPISGWGMGVDRIVTLLTGQENVRDTVFFPLMRPKD